MLFRGRRPLLDVDPVSIHDRAPAPRASFSQAHWAADPLYTARQRREHQAEPHALSPAAESIRSAMVTCTASTICPSTTPTPRAAAASTARA